MSKSLEATSRVPAARTDPVSASYGIFTVTRVDDGHVKIEAGTDALDAVLASHLLAVLPGQTVAVLLPESNALPALIIAAYPMNTATSPALAYDSASETLTLTAKRLRLVGENGVEVLGRQCRLMLQSDGTFEVRAEQIVSSAIETHRIEGGAIELN